MLIHLLVLVLTFADYSHSGNRGCHKIQEEPTSNETNPLSPSEGSGSRGNIRNLPSSPSNLSRSPISPSFHRHHFQKRMIALQFNEQATPIITETTFAMKRMISDFWDARINNLESEYIGAMAFHRSQYTTEYIRDPGFPFADPEASSSPTMVQNLASYDKCYSQIHRLNQYRRRLSKVVNELVHELKKGRDDSLGIILGMFVLIISNEGSNHSQGSNGSLNRSIRSIQEGGGAVSVLEVMQGPIDDEIAALRRMSSISIAWFSRRLLRLRTDFFSEASVVLKEWREI